MNEGDESELRRLTSLLRIISEQPSVVSNPEQLEALQKAALALVLTFLAGDRAELEDFYRTNSESLPEDLASLNSEDLFFRLQDPEAWVNALNENPKARAQIESGQFSPGSMGEFLQKAMRESKLRSEAGNVRVLKKPENNE